MPRARPLRPTATRSPEDGDEQLARLKLIAALADVRGLPLSRVRDVLTLVDAPGDDPIETLGRAVGALPPYVGDPRDDYPRAREAIAVLGLTYDPDFTAVAQLDDALHALDAAGLDASPAVLRRYGDAMRKVAAEEIAPVAEMPIDQAVSYAVLGTALYEPVMLALRRLAHHHLLVERGGSAGPGSPAG
jgi:hypothetical protein